MIEDEERRRLDVRRGYRTRRGDTNVGKETRRGDEERS